MNRLSTDRHFVYRVYDENDWLLYVGATSKREERMKEYEKRPSAAVIRFDEYPSRAEAFTAERALIFAFQPPWNSQSREARPVPAFVDSRGQLRGRCGQYASADLSGPIEGATA